MGSGDDGAAPAAAEAAATRPELTELSPGLLELLDLVLQHEHGHCECQQRQKLQLGRHHDSEQPHQIIHIERLVSSCSKDEEEEVLEEETQEAHSGGGGYKAAECPCMALSPPLCVCPLLMSGSFGFNPHAVRSCPCRLFWDVEYRRKSKCSAGNNLSLLVVGGSCTSCLRRRLCAPCSAVPSRPL